MKTKLIICYLFCIGFYTPLFCQNALNDSIVSGLKVSEDEKDYFKKTITCANEFAIKMTGAKSLQPDFFEVYYEIDEKPVAGVFGYSYTNGSKSGCLTLAFSLKSERPVLKYYYFNNPVEAEWKARLKASKEQKIIICSFGTFLKQSENNYIKYPEGISFDKKSLVEKSEETDLAIINSPKNKFSSDSVFPGAKGATANEVIIPGVPNYLWYLNCGLTANTMIMGYWDDKGYGNLIPGGNSVNGHYWAYTEESCYFGESQDFNKDPMIYYAGAKEYGNNYTFKNNSFTKSSYSLDGYWNQFVKMIDSTQNPLGVTWNGPPYGAHATVGIGYKVDGAQRFLILNDTWSNVSAYINYDEYYQSVAGFDHYFPVSKKSIIISSASQYGNSSSTASLTLEPMSLNISPALSPDIYAYHSFEMADLNGDHLEDLIICNYRNNTGTSGVKIYYNSGGIYTEDTRFRPKAEWFECANISRTFDYDKDGDLDIAVTGYWSPVVIFKNDRDSIKNTPIIVDDAGRGFIDLAYGDYDLDGNIDLVASSVDGQLRLYHNDNGTFSKGQVIDARSQSYKVKLCDINNDHYPDLIASYRSGTIKIYYNQGGSFHSTPDFSPPGHGSLTFDVADLNNDGWPDIITSSDGKILVYYSVAGTFSYSPVHVNDNLDCYPRDIVATDLNQDSYPEVIIADFNRPNIILGNNAGTLEAAPVWQSGEVDPTINVRVFDNNNGERRLLFGKSRGGRLEFYKTSYLANQFTVSPGTRNVGSAAGITTFDIISTTAWTVTKNATWLTVSPVNGNGNGYLTAGFESNNSGGERTAIITITGTGTISHTVKVTQSVLTDISGVNDHKISVYPNPTSGLFDVTINEPFKNGCNIEFYNTSGNLVSVKRISVAIPL